MEEVNKNQPPYPEFKARDRPALSKPQHRPINLQTVVKNTIDETNFTRNGIYNHYYDSGTGERRIREAVTHDGQAKIMLNAARENFDQIEQNHKQFMAGQNQKVIVSPEAADYIKQQTPKVIGIIENRPIAQKQQLNVNVPKLNVESDVSGLV